MKRAAILAVLLAGAAPQSSPPDFDRDIRPIFQSHCISCHGAKKMKGQLRLDSKALAFRGGVSGKVLVPGQAKQSRLVAALRDPNPDDRMPKDAAPLPEETIARIQAWIDAGAAWPDDPADAAAKTEKHWAYVPPVRRELPKGIHPIDYFVSAE